MPTRHLTAAPDRLGERLSMATLQARSHPLKILEDMPKSSRHQKYKESPLYADVVYAPKKINAVWRLRTDSGANLPMRMAVDDLV